MAKCEREITHVAPILTVLPDETEIVLRMTEEEAGTLRQLLSRIGGDPAGPRAVLDFIGMALYAAHVKKTAHKIEIYYGGLGGVPYLRIEKGG